MASIVIGVLQRRGLARAMVVHGHDATDELVTSGPSTVWELRDGAVTEYEVHPGDLGLATVAAEQIRGGGEIDNAAIAHRVFAGEPGPYRDIISLNAAAGLVVGGVAADLSAGLELARASIDTGAAASALANLVRVSAEP
jgi:anthranilate phosphoribosyltransferase